MTEPVVTSMSTVPSPCSVYADACETIPPTPIVSTPTPVPPAAPNLPDTGGDTMTLAIIALAVILVGVILALAAWTKVRRD